MIGHARDAGQLIDEWRDEEGVVHGRTAGH